jgi:hypothetical protein
METDLGRFPEDSDSTACSLSSSMTREVETILTIRTLGLFKLHSSPHNLVHEAAEHNACGALGGETNLSIRLPEMGRRPIVVERWTVCNLPRRVQAGDKGGLVGIEMSACFPRSA